jgi:membrane fusion protein, multidrug efflux system
MINRERIAAFNYWPQLITVLIICAAYIGYRYFAYYDTRSNDAYISANIINMASLVKGPISKIYIKENQSVKKGDKLIEIDPSLYYYAMQKAKADYNIARQHLDDNEILSALAIYNQANYLYEHTTIFAPADGFITNFNLRRGQYIKTGEGLFALVETSRWWVVTRYRETAIRLIKPGDKAKITIDMYPGKVFHGHVKSIGWGINRVQSGSVAPSTLEYMEATENWIKIAQRFPVRIYIDDVSPDYPLRIGASATTTTYR